MANRSKELLKKYPSLAKNTGQDDFVEWKDGREAEVLKYIKTHPEHAQFKGNPTKILEAVDHFSYQTDFLISIGPDKARVIENLLAKEKPKVIVELGGYLGYSAIMFGNYLKTSGQAGHVWSLEFEPEFAEIMRELIDLAGLSDLVTVVTGAADVSLRKLKQDGKVDHIDLLFLDHVEDLYEQDFKVTMDLGLLKRGSCVLADNVVRPGAPEYRAYVRGDSKLQSEGLKGLIMPGEFEDELEFTTVL